MFFISFLHEKVRNPDLLLNHYAGFFSPQLLLKLPVFSVLHFGQIHFAFAGLASPQFVQNLPVFAVPHFGHVHPAAGAAG